MSSSTVRIIVERIASSTDAEDIYNLIAYENAHRFDPMLQSFVPDPKGPNGREDSWGLLQINLPSHKEISLWQAQDALWSIRWAAGEFAAGRKCQWTGYRIQHPGRC